MTIPFFPKNRVRLEWLLVIGAVSGVCLQQGGAGIALFAVVTATFFLVLPWRQAGMLLAAVLAGFASARMQNEFGEEHYAALLGNRNRGGELRVRVTDAGVTGCAWLTPPAPLKSEVIAFRLAGETDWRTVSGKTLLYLPYGSDFRPEYGDLLLVSGRFQLPRRQSVRLAPDGTLLPDRMENTFARYLAVRDSAAIFRADSVQRIGRKPGWMGRILRIRDRCLEAVVRRMNDPRFAANAAGLFFGCRSGMDDRTRLELIRSGTIHLYAVSGLHVGALALVLFWLLRPLPFRIRHLVLPLLILVYVVTTGANAPAVRAFGMITVWCLLRAMLMRTSPLNILGVLAAVLVVLQPAYVRDAGFLYSFVITGVLLLLARNWQRSRGIFYDPESWMPPSPLRNQLHRKLQWRREVLLAVISCTAAFLGGAAISLAFQGMFFPGAVAANILLLPVVGWMFAVMLLKLLSGWLWNGWDWLLARLLDGLFAFLDLVAGTVANWFEATASGRPDGWTVWIFYGALAGLLWPGRGVLRRWLAAAVLLGMLGFWHLLPERSVPGILVCREGGMDFPSVAVADPEAGVGIICNVPDAGSARALADFLRERGIRRVDRVVFSRPRSGAVKGLQRLLREMPVGVVELPERDRYDRHFIARLEEVRKTHPDLKFVEHPGSLLQVVVEKTGRGIEYFNPGSNFKSSVFFEEKPKPQLRVSVGGRVAVQHIMKSSIMEMMEYEFRP